MNTDKIVRVANAQVRPVNPFRITIFGETYVY